MAVGLRGQSARGAALSADGPDAGWRLGTRPDAHAHEDVQRILSTDRRSLLAPKWFHMTCAKAMWNKRHGLTTIICR